MHIDSDSIVAAARKSTGLEIFDSDSYREGLDLVARNIGANPTLSEAGRQMLAGVSVACLSNRLRVADYARRHPEVLDRAVERPIFILGAPRTGTTLTSHLLAADPRWRPLLRWEALNSVPPPTQETLRTDPRCLAQKEAENEALLSASHIHHEEADTPTECVIVHAQDFKSLMFDVACDDPVYARWILGCNLEPTYRYHKLLLQVLQRFTRGRWMLKAPSHALFVHDLLKVYPDARLVWTHRDPYRALGSLCSLISAYRRMFAKVDEGHLGEQYLEHFKLHLTRPEEVDEVDPGRIYHLQYASLVKDPVGELRRLYGWLGEDLTEGASSAIQAWLTHNPQGKYGRHLYQLETYGLSVDRLRPHLQQYVERYRVATEG
jgi:Sulfotransferase family